MRFSPQSHVREASGSACRPETVHYIPRRAFICLLMSFESSQALHFTSPPIFLLLHARESKEELQHLMGPKPFFNEPSSKAFSELSKLKRFREASNEGHTKKNVKIPNFGLCKRRTNGKNSKPRKVFDSGLREEHTRENQKTRKKRFARPN